MAEKNCDFTETDLTICYLLAVLSCVYLVFITNGNCRGIFSVLIRALLDINTATIPVGTTVKDNLTAAA